MAKSKELTASSCRASSLESLTGSRSSRTSGSSLGLRTQPSKAIGGHTPFFMVYGSEAIISADLIHGAPRVSFDNITEAEKSSLEDL